MVDRAVSPSEPPIPVHEYPGCAAPAENPNAVVFPADGLHPQNDDVVSVVRAADAAVNLADLERGIERTMGRHRTYLHRRLHRRCRGHLISPCLCKAVSTR